MQSVVNLTPEKLKLLSNWFRTLFKEFPAVDINDCIFANSISFDSSIN
jgi:hypothetical protein